MAIAPTETEIAPGTEVVLTSLRTNRTVGCRVDGPLGVGGTAKVFAGTLEDGGQAVLKCPRHVGELDQSFEVEVKLHQKLFHRNIIHSVGVGVLPQGQPILAFRRAYENPLLLMTKSSVVEGMRRDRKARSPSLPIDATVDLAYELLNALEYLESLGLVHHDVKLANLLIDVAPREKPLEANAVFGLVVRREYRGVLIDFGATRERAFLEALSRGETPPGPAPQITPLYAPPEAVVETRRPDGTLGVTFDPSLDVYAAAIVIYAMFTGHQPYSHLREPPTASDLESVIDVKSAERRGEIEPLSQEVIQRVVLEDTKFTTGDRAVFDVALHRFLKQRLLPDPARRGTAAEMKREFAKVAAIRAGQADEGVTGSAARRVHLPFTQELVRVGSGGEHPLLTAARLYCPSLEVAPSQTEGETSEPATPEPQTPAPPTPAPPARGSGTHGALKGTSSGTQGALKTPGSERHPVARTGTGRHHAPATPAPPSQEAKPGSGTQGELKTSSGRARALTPAPPPARNNDSSWKRKSSSGAMTVRLDASGQPILEPAAIETPASPPPAATPAAGPAAPAGPAPTVRSAFALALPLGLGFALFAGGSCAVLAVLLTFVAGHLSSARHVPPFVPADQLLTVVTGGVLAVLTGMALSRLARSVRWFVGLASALALAVQADKIAATGSLAHATTSEVAWALAAASGLLLLVPTMGRWFAPEGRAAAREHATGLYAAALAWGTTALVALVFVVPALSRRFDEALVLVPATTRQLAIWLEPVAAAAPAVLVAFVFLLAPLLAVPPARRKLALRVCSLAGLAIHVVLLGGFFLPLIELWRRGARP
jgi:serine/threonine protein kinase